MGEVVAFIAVRNLVLNMLHILTFYYQDKKGTYKAVNKDLWTMVFYPICQSALDTQPFQDARVLPNSRYRSPRLRPGCGKYFFPSQPSTNWDIGVANAA